MNSWEFVERDKKITMKTNLFVLFLLGVLMVEAQCKQESDESDDESNMSIVDPAFGGN